MTQQLHSYSGQNYDRWVQRNSNTTTLGKVQKQFWFTKSAVIRKLGKKEDEHVVASDAELDAKIELFKAIETSTKNLQVCGRDRCEWVVCFLFLFLCVKSSLCHCLFFIFYVFIINFLSVFHIIIVILSMFFFLDF